MNELEHQKRAEDALWKRIERAKQTLRELQSVLTLHVEGLEVTLIAKRLCIERRRVYRMLEVLELRSARLKTRQKRAASGMLEAR